MHTAVDAVGDALDRGQHLHDHANHLHQRRDHCLDELVEQHDHAGELRHQHDEDHGSQALQQALQPRLVHHGHHALVEGDHLQDHSQRLHHIEGEHALGIGHDLGSGGRELVN